ncbi:Transcriptional regulatory protein sin3 [Podila humilis]|nr:Transcriptional regulatory protein sin3 [Podila humilis]
MSTPTPPQQPESRMAVAELLVSLGQTQHNGIPAEDDTSAFMSAATGASPMYRTAVGYVASVKKAYANNPSVYADFLEALEKYHCESLTIEQLVRTIMSLFQDQPDLLMGFKEFLPEAQNLLNRLVPPVMYSDYKANEVEAESDSAAQLSTNIPPTAAAAASIAASSSSSSVESTQEQSEKGSTNIQHILNNNGHAAADFLTMVKNLSAEEPDMYQHMISFLRRFQKDHSYATLYFYVSIILRYHPKLLQRFHNFLPRAESGVEVTEPRVISKAPPEELVVSPDFIEAKDFIQTVKHTARTEMSMYDRFISALEKYQRTGWTIDQVYSEVSLIFWNHPLALADFKQFISMMPQQQ